MRGIKNISRRGDKVSLAYKILEGHNTKILSLQETRIQSQSEIPKHFKNLEHIYKICLWQASPQDPGSGILVFVKNTREFKKSNSLEKNKSMEISFEGNYFRTNQI